MKRRIDRIEAEVRAQRFQHRRTGLPRLVRLMGAAGLAAGAFALGTQADGPGQAVASPDGRIDAIQGELDLRRLELERLQRAYEASAKYGIGADLAMAIEEIALAEQIDPKLAFELVRVESRFNPRAVSSAGALGLAQVMPETARKLAPGITREQLFDRETNLRLGFKHLRWLITYYRGDLRLALLAYNRGPGRVDALLAQGIDPGNGYPRLVLGRD